MYADWIPEDPRSCTFDLEEKKSLREKNFCELPWKEAVIIRDRPVQPCCSVYQDGYSFGNAFSEGLQSIWNGPACRAARREIAGHANDRHTICHICKSTGYTHF